MFQVKFLAKDAYVTVISGVRDSVLQCSTVHIKRILLQWKRFVRSGASLRLIGRRYYLRVQRLEDYAADMYERDTPAEFASLRCNMKVVVVRLVKTSRRI